MKIITCAKEHKVDFKAVRINMQTLKSLTLVHVSNTNFRSLLTITSTER